MQIVKLLEANLSFVIFSYVNKTATAVILFIYIMYFREVHFIHTLRLHVRWSWLFISVIQLPKGTSTHLGLGVKPLSHVVGNQTISLKLGCDGKI